MYIVVGVIAVCIWSWIIWEVYHAPTLPGDHDFSEEEETHIDKELKHGVHSHGKLGGNLEDVHMRQSNEDLIKRHKTKLSSEKLKQ